jgi:thiamine biosynthesis protein ThiS
MINIVLNGENSQFEQKICISELLKQLHLSDKRLAVEVNQAIIMRSEFDNFILSDDDQVEIVQAIGGGAD